MQITTLSIDCGTKNLGWSLWSDDALLAWGLERLVDASVLVL